MKESDKKSVYVIFPCFNEEEGLEKLLARVKGVRKVSGLPINLVIVNDGSKDHTLMVAKSFADEMPMHIIDFPKNRGVAAVFNTAFAYVMDVAGDDDILVTIDSDNTMNPYIMLDMFDAIQQADVVIASRFVKGGRMVGAGYRALLSHVAAWLMNWKVGIPGISDYSVFYRAYRKATLKGVFEKYNGQPVEGRGFSCMANLLMRIHDYNPETRFVEVPLVLRYDMKEGGSAVRIPQTILGYLKLAFGSRGK
jgi:dolichol-phosphate mannosyltransferase